MKSSATTVKDYIAGVPEDRRAAISAVRDLVNAKLPKGYRETIGYGMITWSVPLEVYADTPSGLPLMYAALASQKQYMAVYLRGVHGDSPGARAFRDAFAKAGKKLDMGKSCVRFRRLEDLHLPAIGRVIAACSLKALVARERSAGAGRATRPRKAKPAAARAPARAARSKAAPAARRGRAAS